MIRQKEGLLTEYEPVRQAQGSYRTELKYESTGKYKTEVRKMQNYKKERSA